MPTVLSPTVHAWVSEAREMQCEASLINTTKSYHLKTNLKTMAWPKKKEKSHNKSEEFSRIIQYHHSCLVIGLLSFLECVFLLCFLQYL